MSLRRIGIAGLLVVTGTVASSAQNEPIKGPEDARCRDEARDLVFSGPNPKRLSPFDLGAEIYHACMRRLGAEGGPPPRR